MAHLLTSHVVIGLGLFGRETLHTKHLLTQSNNPMHQHEEDNDEADDNSDHDAVTLKQEQIHPCV